MRLYAINEDRQRREACRLQPTDEASNIAQTADHVLAVEEYADSGEGRGGGRTAGMTARVPTESTWRACPGSGV